MTMVWLEGFETYGPTVGRSGFTDVYNFRDDLSETEVGIGPGRNSGQAISIQQGGTVSNAQNAHGPQLPLSALSTQDDWIMGVAIQCPTGFTNSLAALPIFQFANSEHDRMLTLGINAAGTNLKLWRGWPGDISADIQEAPHGMTSSEWNYIELKVNFHGSTGSYEARVNELTILSGSGANTTRTGGTQPYVLTLGASTNKLTRYDDWIVMDDQGSFNNDFLGDVSVERLKTNGVGTDSNFTPSAAVANWTLLNEADEDGDTTYVESRTGSIKDSYNYENVPAGLAVIHGVVAKPVIRKTLGGSRAFKVLCLSNVTEQLSPQFSPGVDFVRLQHIFETDPDTATSWDAAGVNAAEFGIQLTV
jgi:hypothetical protein